jgi:hypothetical protein
MAESDTLCDTTCESEGCSESWVGDTLETEPKVSGVLPEAIEPF